MYSAAFILSYAPELSENAKADFTAALQAAADAVSAVNFLAPVLEGSFQGGDLLFELGFESKETYLAAKGSPAFEALKALVDDEARISGYEFVAYGEGRMNLQSAEAKCHRLLIFEVYPGTPMELIEKMETLMPDMCLYIPGLLNCKLARVEEASGHRNWNYAFECDYDDPATFFSSYMFRPYHWANVDKFFEPSCQEFMIDPDLCTPCCPAESAFLYNYKD